MIPKNGIHIPKIEDNALNLLAMKAYLNINYSFIYFLNNKYFNFWQYGIPNIPKVLLLHHSKILDILRNVKIYKCSNKQEKFLSVIINIKYSKPKI